MTTSIEITALIDVTNDQRIAGFIYILEPAGEPWLADWEVVVKLDSRTVTIYTPRYHMGTFQISSPFQPRASLNVCRDIAEIMQECCPAFAQLIPGKLLAVKFVRDILYTPVGKLDRCNTITLDTTKYNRKGA